MSVRLRLIRPDDLEMIRAWRMLPEITRYMYTDPAISPDDQRRWYGRISDSPTDRVWIIEQDDGLAIGLLSLSDIDWTNRRCCWAYYIAREEGRGRGLARILELGIASYVFETLKLNRLWCEVLAFNDRVVKLHELFGSKVEGVLRQHIVKHGVTHDVVRMAILREEWTAVKARFEIPNLKIEERAA
jgi:UDP-4-amino-4,6-dideoxy-N-acetyl-beta-L-altrosamine N-acetyltransferase